MTEAAQQVDHRNDVLTIIAGETYIVHLTGKYATTGRYGPRLAVTVQMAEKEARALLAGLQEALA